MYNHLQRADIPSARLPFTTIDDDTLDHHVSEISLQHPFTGISVIVGHLKAQGIHLPYNRVQESLRRVDAIGILVR
jgi:hypothetical protein